MSDPSFQEPAASTSDSNEPDSTSPPNAKSTRGDAASSPPTGPTPPATTTSPTWHGLSLVGTDYATGDGIQPPLKAGNDRLPPLIFSAADFPAKTSPSPDDEPDSTAPAPACSSNTPESQLNFNQDGSWSKTSQGFSPLPTAATLPSFSQRWPTSGMASPGGYWTLATSESPNDAVECSLSDVLEATPNPRYALSARAATGILRRARARGRELPPELEAALRALS